MKPIDPSLAHRLFYPGVPAVLAAQSGKTVAAMPVISYASLSERPPIFGVSCARRSFTLKVVTESKAFSISLLGAEHVNSLGLLATTRGRRGSDKLVETGLEHRSGSRLSVPVISESAASLECSLIKRVALGDHVLLVGRVAASHASADFRGYWRFKSYNPILYTGWQGGMSTYPSSRRRT